MVTVTKYPVLIIGAPRTGTTVLSRQVREHNPNLKEYFHEPSKDMIQFQKFLEYGKNNDDYLIKLQGKQLSEYPDWFLKKLSSNDMFIIKMRRLDIIKQITSFYIASSRNKWYYGRDIDWVAEEIKIDLRLINNSITHIETENTIVDQINYDVEVLYESIENVIPNDVHSLKTPQPSNYEEIKQAIEERYKCNAY
jgi:LPS sulfotransferase NodH